MGFNSQSGQLGFGIQTLKGTAVAATRFARVKSGSLGGDRSLLIPDPEIGGNRDIPSAYLGPVAFNGDFEFYPRMEMMAVLLKACLGASSSSAASTANEVQTITTTGVPTGGTFRLKFRGETSGTIPWNATNSQVQTALLAMAIFGGSGVTCTVGPLPTGVVCTFNAAYAGQNTAPLIPVSVLLTGGTAPTVVVTETTPGLPAVGTHIITPADTSPWITIEERIGTSLESFRYTDGKVNSFKLNSDANGFLMGGCSVTALRQVSGFTAQTNPAYDTTPQFVGSQVNITLGGVALPSKTFSLEVMNNIETDDFVLGSVFRTDLTEKRREIKMGLSYRPQDSTLWKAAMFGNSALTSAAAGPGYQGAVQITMSSYETIGNVVAGTPFSLVIDIPNAVVAPYKFSPSGDDVIQTDLEITPIRPDNAVPIITCTVVDDLATVV